MNFFLSPIILNCENVINQLTMSTTGIITFQVKDSSAGAQLMKQGC